MAPTGLAAKRMAESTGMNSETIHKACGLVPADNPSGFKAQGECRICGFVGIDEMSMVGEHLFAFAVDAVLNSPLRESFCSVILTSLLRFPVAMCFVI